MSERAETTESEAGKKVVGQWELLEVLGEGGMATTYLGRSVEDERLVAVKAIQLVKTKNRKQIELFERESEALQALDHPQIPSFFETLVGETDETITLYLVQEFVNGRSLRRRLDDGHPFSSAEVVEIMLSCLEALEYLHGLDPPLYHRDLKPSNIITKSDGTSVLVDFGAVREALSDPKVAGSSVVGTFGYMAPEQFQARACAGTDLYSLGATAVHLLSGRGPETMEVKRLKPNIHRYIDVDAHLGAILDLLMEPAAEDRYQSALSLKNALTRWVDEHPDEMEVLRGSHRFTPSHPHVSVPLPQGAGGLSIRDIVPKGLSETRPAAGTPIAGSPAVALGRSADAMASTAETAEALGVGPRMTPASRPVVQSGPSPTAKEEAAPDAADTLGEAAAATGASLDTAGDGAVPTSSDGTDSAPSAPVEASRDDKPTKSASSSKKAAKQTPKKKKRRKKRDSGAQEVPLKRVDDPALAALVPTSVLCGPVGTAFVVGGAVLVLVGVLRAAPIALVAGVMFIVYGAAYGLAARMRDKRQQGDNFLEHTSGVLHEIVVHRSPLGRNYLVLHYRFSVGDKVFRGTRVFNNRDAARPFLKRNLKEMIYYDDMDPKRSALDLPVG